MAKRFSEKRRAELLAKFERWKGGTAVFCRKHRVSYQSLRTWRQAQARSCQPVRAAQFVEVELPPRADGSMEQAAEAGCQDARSPRTAKTEVPPTPVAELHLGSGMLLRVYATGEQS